MYYDRFQSIDLSNAVGPSDAWIWTHTDQNQQQAAQGKASNDHTSNACLADIIGPISPSSAQQIDQLIINDLGVLDKEKQNIAGSDVPRKRV